MKTYDSLLDARLALQKQPATSGNVVLVIGITGSGKSTFTQFIAGDFSQLESRDDDDDFLIFDLDGKQIGAGVVSKTTLPELVVDAESGTHVYDFPGYGDTRGRHADILTSSILRRVARGANGVKIALVVSYASVQKGEDRLRIVELLRHAASFVRNMKRYERSVALVVSKVPHYRRLPDDKLKSKTAKFLVEVKAALPDLRSDGVPGSEAVVSTLIDALVEKDESGSYPRIGIFRAPDKEGPLEAIPSLKNAREKLRQMILEETTFVEPEVSDFGDLLSEASTFVLKDSVAKVIQDGSTLVQRTVQKLRKHYEESTSFSKDIWQKEKWFNERQQLLGEAIGELRSERHPKRFLQVMVDSTRNDHACLSVDDLEELAKCSDGLEFLQSATDAVLWQQLNEWVRPLTELQRYASDCCKWYSFLADLFTALSEYDVQKDRTGVKNALKLRSGSVECKTAAHIAAYVASEKLIQKPEAADGWVGLAEVEPNGAVLYDLTLVLRCTLSHSPEHQWDARSGILTIHGDFVTCKNVAENLTFDRQGLLRQVRVFARNTFFVDEDLQLTGTGEYSCDMAIVAPRWVVIGRRQITLQGADGEEPRRKWTAMESSDGERGSSGKPGGSFLGVGRDFVNGDSLTILSQGGAGGAGQDGADGEQGEDGRDGEQPTWWFSDRFSETRPGGQKTEIKSWFTIIVYSQKNVTVYGSEGAPGGDGGIGGRGGSGGSSGCLKMIQLSEGSGVSLKTATGPPGRSGRGGKGGCGGRNGDDVDFWLYNAMGVYTSRWIATGRRSNGSQHPGRDNSNVVVDDGTTSDVNQSSEYDEDEEKLTKNGFTDMSLSVLLSYKKFAVQSLSEAVLRPTLVEFLRMLDGSEELPSTVRNFAEELQNLNEACLLLNGNTELLLPLYNSLLSRIKATKMSSEKDRGALDDLQSAVLSKTMLARSEVDPELVVDVFSYVQDTKKSIREDCAAAAQRAFRERVKAYRRGALIKIEQRMEFVATKLAPAIEQAAQELQRSIESIQKEVQQMRLSLHAHRRSLRARKFELQKSRFMQVVLDIVSVVACGACGVFCARAVPLVKEVIDRAANSVAGMKRSVNDEDIQGGIDECRRLMEAWSRKSRTEGISAAVELLQRFARTVSTSADESRTSGVEAREELPASIHYVETTTQDSADELEDTEISAKMDLIQSSAVQMMDELRSTLQILADEGASALDVHQLRLQNTLWRLKRFLFALGRDLQAPWSLQMCLDYLDSTLGSFAAILDQVEQLGDRLELVQLFNVSAEMTNDSPQCIAGTTSVLPQNGPTRRGMTRWLMGSVASAVTSTARLLYASDSETPSETDSALAKLRHSMEKNLALERYNSVLHYIGLLVFPFAEDYLGGLEPLDCLWTDDKNTLTEWLSKQLDTLQKTLERHRQTVLNGDKYVFVRDFSVASGSPFFVWRHATHGHQVDALLSGREVALVADVLQSPNDAVKFKEVSLEFEARDKDMQRELDAALESVQVKLIHMGDSLYKCGSQVYSIHTPAQTLQFSVGNGRPGSPPSTTNQVYNKLTEGDALLSPYATWTVKLEASPPAALSRLAAFQGDVDLYLTGRGQYVQGYHCQHLDKYYRCDPTKSAINFAIDSYES